MENMPQVEATQTTPTVRDLTYGEKAVGLTFNPSNNADVQEIKELYAKIIDKMNNARTEAGQGEKGRLCSTVHGAGRVMGRREAAGKKKWRKEEQKREIIKEGRVNFNTVKEYMKSKGIELVGAGADEAPECYKSLKEVLKYQGNTVKVLHTLTPIGVAMAGEDVYDPYKD